VRAQFLAQPHALPRLAPAPLIAPTGLFVAAQHATPAHSAIMHELAGSSRGKRIASKALHEVFAV
jgi:hypothetical protein